MGLRTTTGQPLKGPGAKTGQTLMVQNHDWPTYPEQITGYILEGSWFCSKISSTGYTLATLQYLSQKSFRFYRLITPFLCLMNPIGLYLGDKGTLTWTPYYGNETLTITAHSLPFITVSTRRGIENWVLHWWRRSRMDLYPSNFLEIIIDTKKELN